MRTQLDRLGLGPYIPKRTRDMQPNYDYRDRLIAWSLKDRASEQNVRTTSNLSVMHVYCHIIIIYVGISNIVSSTKNATQARIKC